jgi:hypothetical protein
MRKQQTLKKYFSLGKWVADVCCILCVALSLFFLHFWCFILVNWGDYFAG